MMNVTKTELSFRKWNLKKLEESVEEKTIIIMPLLMRPMILF